MKRSTILRSLVALMLLTGSGVGLLSVYAWIVYTRAGSILGVVRSIRIGSSMAEVERAAANVDRSTWVKRCEMDTCYYDFAVDNTWLRRAHVEPQALFQAHVELQAGKVREIRVSLLRDTNVYPTFPSGGQVSEYARFSEMDRADGSDTPYNFPQPIGKPYIHVHLRSDATPDQRQRAYAFALGCLIKPGGGCDLPCDYLPMAWKDWVPLWENEPQLRHYYAGRTRCR